MRVIEASALFQGEPATLFFDDSDDPLFGGWGLELKDGSTTSARQIGELVQRLTELEPPTQVRERTEKDTLGQMKKDISAATTIQDADIALRRGRAVTSHLTVYTEAVEGRSANA